MARPSTALIRWAAAPGRDQRVAIGPADAPTEPGTPENMLRVLVLPGEEVALHWQDLPATLAPAQAAAAARLHAADRATVPMEQLHVAIGAADDTGRRMVALVDRERMAAHLAAVLADGFDPDLILPEPLLLPLYDDAIAICDRHGRRLVRGPTLAFAAEPALAVTILADTPVHAIDETTFTRGLGAAIATAPLNLRQGDFARQRQWWPDRAQQRRVAIAAAFAAALFLATPLALALRYQIAAMRIEADTAALAARVVPSTPGIVPIAQLRGTLEALQGPGAGFKASISALFDALQPTPTVELTGLRFEGGLMQAKLRQDDGGLRNRLRARGFIVSGGAHGAAAEIVMAPQ